MINTAHRDWNSEATAEVKRLLQQQGYAYLQQLPDHFDHLAFAEQIGTLIPHQYNGEYVFSIRVNPEIGDRYPAFTTREVEPHTEAYEYAKVPMHYQGLWCVSPPTCVNSQQKAGGIGEGEKLKVSQRCRRVSLRRRLMNPKS